jgi:putative glutamine amidotransferase
MIPRIAVPQARSNPEYNAEVMPQYCGAVAQAGGEPVEIALDLSSQQIARLASTCDAVLLPGCPADVNPEKYGAARHPRTAEADALRDNADELLLQDAYNMRKPVLGICFGLQSLNVWRSGTLRQHLETGVRHTAGSNTPLATHSVLIDSASRLGGIVQEALAATDPLGMGSFPERGEGSAFLEQKVNSFHHQAVLKPGDGLHAVALSPDDQVIEALESTEARHWVLAVQWHPERMMQDPVEYAIFAALVRAARDWHKHPRVNTVDFESAR